MHLTLLIQVVNLFYKRDDVKGGFIAPESCLLNIYLKRYTSIGENHYRKVTIHIYHFCWNYYRMSFSFICFKSFRFVSYYFFSVNKEKKNCYEQVYLRVNISFSNQHVTRPLRGYLITLQHGSCQVCFYSAGIKKVNCMLPFV